MSPIPSASSYFNHSHFICPPSPLNSPSKSLSLADSPHLGYHATNYSLPNRLHHPFPPPHPQLDERYDSYLLYLSYILAIISPYPHCHA